MIFQVTANPTDEALIRFFQHEFITRRTSKYRRRVAGLSSLNQTGILIETQTQRHTIYLESAWHDNLIVITTHNCLGLDTAFLSQALQGMTESGVTQISALFGLRWHNVRDLVMLQSLLDVTTSREDLYYWLISEHAEFSRALERERQVA